MKKSVLYIGLIIVVIFSLVACNERDEKLSGDENSNLSGNQNIEENNSGDVSNTNNSGENISGDVSNTNNNGENTFWKDEVKVNEEVASEYLKIISEEKNKEENVGLNLNYDLIYFNDDDIPDLVVGENGYWVSLYMYKDGKVYNLADRWPYGAMGNAGYRYNEKRGIIYNDNADFAGAITTSTIYVLNDNDEFDSYSKSEFNLQSGDEQYEELLTEYNTNYSSNYFNDEAISDEEYNAKVKELLPSNDNSNVILLEGVKTEEEITNKLESK